MNRKTFIVLLNSIHFEIHRRSTPADAKKLWGLMDKLLLKHFQEIMIDTRSSFVVVRSYTQQRDIADLNPGVREIILSIVKHNIEKSSSKMNSNDLSVCFKVLTQVPNKDLK